MSELTIVSYHYVRDLKNSRYPEIKGLDTELFKAQLKYFEENYTVIRTDDLILHVNEGIELPSNSLLLTFDDGYMDHFETVLPLLKKFDFQGSFFPPVAAALERKVLDVNKIHFVLASVPDKRELLESIHRILSEKKVSIDEKRHEELFREAVGYHRFDSEEVVRIKLLLQKSIPDGPRKEIIDALFSEYVSKDERSFANELYMSEEHLKKMLAEGMFIGSHGSSHVWMNLLTPEEQEKDIMRSLEFLSQLGCDMMNWVMCYPYGGYNDSMIELLKKHDCALAFSSDKGKEKLPITSRYALKRLDTNDLPQGNS